jgi:hypothetical protein
VQHCTPEQLALAALREPLPADDTAHLASCAECRAEVAALQRTVDALAVPEFAAAGASVPPPPRVWDAIAAATGVSASPVLPALPVSNGDPPPAQVLPFRARRRPLLLAAAAVVVGAVVGAGAVAIVQARDHAGQAVEAVALDPLADNDASGRASVVVHDDGSRMLQVDLDAPELNGAYYEVWLIDRSVVGMFPLGVVRPGAQTLELPAGLNLADFPLVDVSVEPLDGNPTHSGVSVVRGELTS